MNGFVHMNLPPFFDFYSDFTLSGWIFGGSSPNNAIAIGIECREMRDPILQVGKWANSEELQVIHHAHNAENYWLSGRIQHNFTKWYHIAIVYHPGLVMFYLGGDLQSKREIRLTPRPLSGVCFSFYMHTPY
jgi:hypothetical protein